VKDVKGLLLIGVTRARKLISGNPFTSFTPDEIRPHLLSKVDLGTRPRAGVL
jgi:hypothetical protein